MNDIDRDTLDQIRREVEDEFPDYAMMQEIHFVRRIHQLQTEGMTVREKAAFYNTRASNNDVGIDGSDG